MKVLILADMEEISGVVYWPQPQVGGRDATDMETVATKQGLAHGLALLYPLAEVREALAAGAERDTRRLKQFKPFAIEGPPYRVRIVMGGGRETRRQTSAACSRSWKDWMQRASDTPVRI